MVRDTVDTVSSLKENEVSLDELAAKLGLDKSVTSRRVRDAPAAATSSTWKPDEADRRRFSRRSDAGNAEAAVRTGRIERVIRGCSVGKGMTSFHPHRKLERRRTDDFPAVPAPHFIGLGSIGRPGRTAQLFLEKAAGTGRRI